MSRTINRKPSGSTLGAKYVWEVAEDLLCSESQVVTLIREGKLRARRIGKRRYIIMPDDLQEYLAQSRTEGDQPKRILGAQDLENFPSGAKIVLKVARDLLCSENQVVNLIREGKLRVKQIGKGRLIIRLDDVSDILQHTEAGENQQEQAQDR